MTLQELKKQRPYQYEIVCQKTGKATYQNFPPMLCDLQTYEPTDKENVFELKQTKVCYIDTRYEARLRLWKYKMRKAGYVFQRIKPNLPLP